MDTEANKNKAEEYIKLAKEASTAGNIQKAEMYLSKAHQLNPSERTKLLLDTIRAAMGSGDGQQESRNSVEELGNSASLQEAPRPNYTPEQLRAVQRVLELKDYYEILGVPTDASETEIQRAVRNLALIIHPDKNPAPGATEAMTEVNHAAAILLVASSRLDYDRRRQEALRRDLTPEEMFSMFFKPDALPSLEQMMPWLVGAAGAALVGAGVYALFSAFKECDSDSDSETPRGRATH